MIDTRVSGWRRWALWLVNGFVHVPRTLVMDRPTEETH